MREERGEVKREGSKEAKKERNSMHVAEFCGWA
jgi:hypothetical protein